MAIFTRDTANALMAEIRENQAKLEACGDHDFDIPPPFTPGGRAVCRHCGGRLDPLQARWYVRGREHEKAAQKGSP